MTPTTSSRFRVAFPGRHVVLPVVHVTDAEQALRNTAVARDAGADGVFLINHGFGSDELLSIHERVTDALPGWWVGVNCLGLDPGRVFERISGRVAGVWTDDAMVYEGVKEQPDAERVWRTSRTRSALYFGGVAFKYQRAVSDLAAVARAAIPFVDVVTTSGPGTGEPPEPAKIRAMKEALGTAALAIASGVTPENVGDYLPWADAFLVATGISTSFDELDPARVRALVARVRAAR